jgi:hypothetical protein
MDLTVTAGLGSTELLTQSIPQVRSPASSGRSGGSARNEVFLSTMFVLSLSCERIGFHGNGIAFRTAERHHAVCTVRCALDAPHDVVPRLCTCMQFSAPRVQSSSAY